MGIKFWLRGLEGLDVDGLKIGEEKL